MLTFVMVAVSTHSRLKAAGVLIFLPILIIRVSTHSRLKAAGEDIVKDLTKGIVSTHSRLKAAGSVYCSNRSTLSRFNTQPPEGGWM